MASFGGPGKLPTETKITFWESGGTGPDIDTAANVNSDLSLVGDDAFPESHNRPFPDASVNVVRKSGKYARILTDLWRVNALGLNDLMYDSFDIVVNAFFVAPGSGVGDGMGVCIVEAGAHETDPDSAVLKNEGLIIELWKNGFGAAVDLTVDVKWADFLTATDETIFSGVASGTGTKSDTRQDYVFKFARSAGLVDSVRVEFGDGTEILDWTDLEIAGPTSKRFPFPVFTGLAMCVYSANGDTDTKRVVTDRCYRRYSN